MIGADRLPTYLPPDVAAGMWRDAAGRTAWRPERAADVVRSAASWRMAVLSGELWCVTNGEAPLNVARAAGSGLSGFEAWRVGHERDPMRESWDRFGARCAAGALAWLESFRAPDFGGSRWRGQPLESWIHLELVREEEYEGGDELP